jgi:hypothetical protein
MPSATRCAPLTAACRAVVIGAGMSGILAAVRLEQAGVPGENSWDENAQGKVFTPSPWCLVDDWTWTREPNLDDFELG